MAPAWGPTAVVPSPKSNLYVAIGVLSVSVDVEASAVTSSGATPDVGVVVSRAASLTGTRRFFGTEHTYVETASLMSGDLHEHLGQLIAYARVNGVTPPWSR